MNTFTILVIIACAICSILLTLLFTTQSIKKRKVYLHYKSEYMKMYGSFEPMNIAFKDWMNTTIYVATAFCVSVLFLTIIIDLIIFGAWKI